MSTSLSFRHILTPDGFERHKRIEIDGAGVIVDIVDETGTRFDGWLALPGMPNAHSHSFQRALTGQGERTEGGDSFWSWREAMYRLAERIGPEELTAISARAFADMVRGGFTSVAEFHYLHHLADGSRGPEMAMAVVEGARIAGIRLVLLPVYYESGGFGEKPGPGQRRFVHESIEDFLALLAEIEGTPLGIAPHSLRAVEPARIARLDERARRVLGDRFPRHVHISEQRREVEQCVAVLGTTPIEALAGQVDLDEQWNLVHATHATADERALLMRSGARVVLCPLTEAYLGDGVFPATDYVRAGGRIAIGSDSNVRIDAVEELRMLEYGQRLVTESRSCLATGEGLGRPLWQRLAADGARALASECGGLAPGMPADLVVLDPGSPVLSGLGGDAALDALVTAGSAADFAAVFVGGKEVARSGRHVAEERVSAAYAAAMQRLREER